MKVTRDCWPTFPWTRSMLLLLWSHTHTLTTSHTPAKSRGRADGGGWQWEWPTDPDTAGASCATPNGEGMMSLPAQLTPLLMHLLHRLLPRKPAYYFYRKRGVARISALPFATNVIESANIDVRIFLFFSYSVTAYLNICVHYYTLLKLYSVLYGNIWKLKSYTNH